MSSDHKTDTRSGGVEVVADQGDDGSFEIRLERQQDAAENTQPADAQRTATWHAQPEAPARRTALSKPVLLGAGIAAAILLLVVGIILAQTPRDLGGGRPQTVEINEQPRFRGYVVAGQEPERASNLRLDTEQPAADSEVEDSEGEDTENDDFDNVSDEENPRRTRINLRSAASGRAKTSPEEGKTPLELAQERRDERRILRQEAVEDLKQEILEYQRQQGEVPQDDIPSEELDGFDDEYYDEFDEELDVYDDEFDEYDDYDLEGVP